MTYQVVTRQNVVAYLEGRAAGKLSHTQLQAEQRGNPEEDWVEQVDEMVDDLLEEWRESRDQFDSSDTKRDELEGRLSVQLFKALADLPSTVLTDRDFWRYVACALYDFVVWRQPPKSVTGQFPYFGAASNGLGRDCVPHRMFNRARIAWIGGTQSERSNAFENAEFGASDMWKSHVLRVANGNAPLVVHEFASDVRSGQLPTGQLRHMVKNLRRVRANVLFEVLDEHQARDLVDRETHRTRVALGLLDDVGSAD